MNFIIRRMHQRKHINQKGTTAVEFSIVLIVFITLLFGIIEFGLLMYNQHVITNAGREGARAGIVSRDVRLDDDYIKNVVKSYAKNHTVTFSEFNWSNDNVIKISNIAWDEESNSDIDHKKCTEFGDSLEVYIEYEYSYFFLPFDKPTPIKSRTAMRCE